MSKHVFDCIDAHTCGNPIRLIKLEKIGVHNAIFGRAFYEGKITLDEIKDHLKK